MKKINFSTQLLLTTLFLITPNIIIGQEFIKSPSVKTSTSIVREVSAHEWLTYSYDGGSEGWFTLVSDLSSTAPTLSMPINYFVNDFEIYNDTVYFCGWLDSNRRVALFGYFELSSSLNNPVYFCRLPEIKMFSKLAVFNNNNKPHVVFTGLMDLSLFFVADAINTTSNSWYFHFATNTTGDCLTYDDIAVTDDYIVATSRIIGLDSGIIHYYQKPMTYTTMFPNFLYRSIGYHTTTPILITNCLGNRFATLCKNSASSFVMSRYNVFNDDDSFKSNIALITGECRDINFNSNDNTVEVLIYESSEKYNGSMALHYDYPLTSYLIAAHLYNNGNSGCDIYSIDYLEHNPHCFLASGTNYYGYGMLELYKYKYDEWNVCPKETYVKAERINNNGRFFSKEHTPMLLCKVAMPLDCSIDQVSVDSLCNY